MISWRSISPSTHKHICSRFHHILYNLSWGGSCSHLFSMAGNLHSRPDVEMGLFFSISSSFSSSNSSSYLRTGPLTFPASLRARTGGSWVSHPVSPPRLDSSPDVAGQGRRAGIVLAHYRHLHLAEFQRESYLLVSLAPPWARTGGSWGDGRCSCLPGSSPGGAAHCSRHFGSRSPLGARPAGQGGLESRIRAGFSEAQNTRRRAGRSRQHPRMA